MHWMDQLYAWAVGRPRFFAGGWGDMRAVDELLELLRVPRDPAPIRPALRRKTSRSAVAVFAGAFESPASGLPPESRTARFELYLPPRAAASPVCVHLASMGDEGFLRRRRIALPLVQRGLGALLLENPYFGARRPRAQEGTELSCVADQFVMNRATIEEARSLLGWLRAEGHATVGVSGYSMGGSMAAYTAVCTPFPVAVVLAATGSSVAHLATRDIPSRFVHWEKLGCPTAARRRFGDALEAVALHRFPPPPDPSRAILLGCRGDGYVDPEGVGVLHRHWSGSTLRWLDTGHVGGLVLHAAALRRELSAAFALTP